MILDTSALVAVLYREPEAAAFAQLIHDAAAWAGRHASGWSLLPPRRRRHRASYDPFSISAKAAIKRA
jgi:uncharacterized protein with PIN domain